MIKTLNTLRPINLVVIVATTLSLVFFVNEECEKIIITYENAFILGLGISAIAAGGYLMNDYFDLETDGFNGKPKPEITNTVRWSMYGILNIIGITIGFFYITSKETFYIFPISSLLLILYSLKLQKMVLLGNISVALLSSMVPILVLLYSIETSSTALPVEITIILLITSILIFLSTLAREIIKDIEDLEGDKLAGYTTLPIIYGLQVSKAVAILVLILLLGGVAYLPMKLNLWNSIYSILALSFLCIIPIISSAILCIKGKEGNHFDKSSNLLKISMFGYIISIITLTI